MQSTPENYYLTPAEIEALRQYKKELHEKAKHRWAHLRPVK